MIASDWQRQEGEKLFKNILSGDVDYRATKAILMRCNLENPLVNLAIEVDGPAKWTFEDIHYLPVFRNSFPLILAGQPDYITLPDSEDMIGTVVEAFGPATKIGVSQPVTLATGFVESISQAKIAPFITRSKNDNCHIVIELLPLSTKNTSFAAEEPELADQPMSHSAIAAALDNIGATLLEAQSRSGRGLRARYNDGTNNAIMISGCQHGNETPEQLAHYVLLICCL